jgi:hypothetical protein
MAKSKIRRVYLASGNSYWVKPVTRKHMKKIYDFLAEKTFVDGKKKKVEFSFSDLSRECGIGRQQVARCCFLMHFL